VCHHEPVHHDDDIERGRDVEGEDAQAEGDEGDAVLEREAWRVEGVGRGETTVRVEGRVEIRGQGQGQGEVRGEG